jgi:hypothetical protein
MLVFVIINFKGLVMFHYKLSAYNHFAKAKDLAFGVFDRATEDASNFFTTKTAVSVYACTGAFPEVSGKIVATNSYAHAASYLPVIGKEAAALAKITSPAAQALVTYPVASLVVCTGAAVAVAHPKSTLSVIKHSITNVADTAKSVGHVAMGISDLLFQQSASHDTGAIDLAGRIIMEDNAADDWTVVDIAPAA